MVNNNWNGKGHSNGGAVDLSLQGKGGVGKSLAASLLTQYFMARGEPVRCIDTDPVNKTLNPVQCARSPAAPVAP